ncbi:MAG TPA: NADH-quinone oxidoreductase subunit NuoH [Anaerolineae bacterium]|nr:NADH-quinone oxidoreductase subunit NuoH [Anaerolineae bacterium]
MEDTELGLLKGLLGDAPWVATLTDILAVVAVGSFALLIVIFLIWMERKVIARMQDRIGPNRVGPAGLGQSFADIAKLLTKEQITPDGADKLAYNAAPVIIVVTAMIMWAVVPFGPRLIGADLNIGLFFILAISSVSVVSVLLAGWGSNNKYALLGAFRSVAQLVSYEVPMVMALLVPIILARSMSTVGIIHAQVVPFIFAAPLSALIFFISSLAEVGRTPFDLLEAESEITAGFHVEYSGMKFAMFQLAEFAGAFFMAGLLAIVYFGGWNIPVINLIISTLGGTPLDLMSMRGGLLIGVIVFMFKMFSLYFLFIWVRATWPRVRVDQILDFNWKFLVPLSLVLLLVTAVLERVLVNAGLTAGWRAVGHLAGNVLIAFAALEIMRRRGRAKRLVSEPEVAADTHAPHDSHGHDDGHAHDVAVAAH